MLNTSWEFWFQITIYDLSEGNIVNFLDNLSSQIVLMSK